MVKPTIDQSTVEWGTSRMRLREDCRFIPQEYRGVTYYHLEVPSTASYFRIGYAEYLFVSLLDGNTTFAEALTIAAQKLGPSALTESQAKRIYTWILDQSLGSFVDGGKSPRVQRLDASMSTGSYSNPLWIKLPLGRPDVWLATLANRMDWLFSSSALFISLVTMGVALYTVAASWEKFVAASHAVLAPSNWLWMAGAWIGLKCLHELGHGLVCRHFGGQVREMGLVFVMFTPMAYVDVTSAWAFTSKWRRMGVAAAGMYFEITVAAVATIVWSRVESTWAAHMLYNIIIMSSATTILFNLNPLMRFDGYYLLSDFLEIPNLASEGQACVMRRAAWLFYGADSGAPNRLGATGWIIEAYGWASVTWKMVTSLSICLVASAMFQGAGVILACIGIAAWLSGTLRQIGPDIVYRWFERPHTLWRAGGVAMGLGALAWGGFGLVPAPLPDTAPGVIDFQDLAVVRCGVAGFVAEVHARDGSKVKRGDLLITLRNDDVVNAYHDVVEEMESSRVRQRMAMERREATAEQIEARNQIALSERLAAAWRKYDSLAIRAPISGRVIGRALSERIDTYLQEGEEILAIGNDRHKEMVLSVSDTMVDHAQSMVGKHVKVRVGARGAIVGTLARVEPRGSTELPHPALSVGAGGPLAIREKSESDANNGSRTELIETRYKAIVRLPDEESQALYSGERGFVSFNISGDSIGKVAYRHATKWIRETIARAKSP